MRGPSSLRDPPFASRQAAIQATKKKLLVVFSFFLVGASASRGSFFLVDQQFLFGPRARFYGGSFAGRTKPPPKGLPSF